MANTISNAFVEQFKANVYHLSQQRGSRLAGKTRVESLVGNVHNFERMGATAAQQKSSRHSDTPILDAPHSRRRVSPTDWEWGDLVDREDKLRLLISPESEYAISGANSLGRAKDDLIIDAFFGNATTGAGVAVPFPNTQEVPIGSSNLDLEKVLAGIQILNENEVDDFDRFFAIGSKQLSAILADPDFTSHDFNAIRVLMAGKMHEYLGLTWLRSERLDLSTADRSCPMWQKQAMGLAVNADMFTRIAERPDKSFAHQVFCSMTMGATRIEEEGVVEVHCDET